MIYTLYPNYTVIEHTVGVCMCSISLSSRPTLGTSESPNWTAEKYSNMSDHWKGAGILCINLWTMQHVVNPFASHSHVLPLSRHYNHFTRKEKKETGLVGDPHKIHTNFIDGSTNQNKASMRIFDIYNQRVIHNLPLLTAVRLNSNMHTWQGGQC